jgi:putative ABC transport system substrate-binding protein
VPGLSEFEPFVRGLGDLGYKPGETVTFECRAAGGRYDGLATAAAELAKIPVDIIIGSSEPAGHAAHKATDTIPIVTIMSGDPVSSGLARTLAKPGGNVTGVSYYATELTAKRLELFKEMLPEVATIDVLANPTSQFLFEEDTKSSRAPRHREIHHARVCRHQDCFPRCRPRAPRHSSYCPTCCFGGETHHALALEQHLPTMAKIWHNVGCLMAYSAQYEQMDYRSLVRPILKGAKAGDLPTNSPQRSSCGSI